MMLIINCLWALTASSVSGTETLDNLQSHEAMLRRRLEFTCMHLIGNALTRTRQVSMMFAEAVCTVRNHPIMVIVLR